MNMNIKKLFLENWKKYFNNAELPITFYYSNEIYDAELVPPPSGHRCVIGDLIKVRKGGVIMFRY